MSKTHQSKEHKRTTGEGENEEGRDAVQTARVKRAKVTGSHQDDGHQGAEGPHQDKDTSGSPPDSNPGEQDPDYNMGPGETSSPLGSPSSLMDEMVSCEAVSNDEVGAPRKRSLRSIKTPQASSPKDEDLVGTLPVVDHNEEQCRVCGSDVDPEKLLCCESCPAVYHLYCLDPPLSRIPRGDWFCPVCTRQLQLQDMERILACRVQETEQGCKRGQKTASQKEYYIKWKGRSYRRCEWVPEDTMLSAAKRLQSVKARLQTFHNKQQALPAGTDGLEELLVNGVNPAWLEVDRIIGEKVDKELGEVVYLVKWKELEHDHCTWERQQDLEDFQEEMKKYKKTRSILVEAEDRAKKGKGKKHSKKKTRTSPQLEDATTGGSPGKGEKRKFLETPGYLKGGSLHPYQLEGLNWLYHKRQLKEPVILADEMGLGKTIQTIALLAALYEDYVSLPHLVVVPLSTIKNWEREFAVWAPYLNIVTLHGSSDARSIILKHEMYVPGSGKKGQEKNLQARVKFHVLLASYEMVSKELYQLAKLQYDTLIVDEGHRLKNKQNRLFQDLLQIKVSHKILLTGTPLQNNLGELFMLMHFLDRDKFSSLEDFSQQYSDISHEDQISQLHALLAPHLLRRLKKDVLKQLPPKMEQIVRVELSPLQRETYKSLLTNNYTSLLAAGKGNQQMGRLKNLMMQLRKCCNHPFLFPDVAPPLAVGDQAATEQLVTASGKLELLDKMMARLKEQGHRVLIYSQFTMVLDVLEDWIVGRGWYYCRIDGSVNSKDRQLRIDKYNEDPDKYFVFLLSTRAGGMGINLATADTVIIYDSDWNPHNDLQAQARAHRLGQRRPVMIYRLVTRDTIEERMMQRAKEKMVLEHVVVRKMNTKEELKQRDLDDILRYGARELFSNDEEDVTDKKSDDGEKVHEGAAMDLDNHQENSAEQRYEQEAMKTSEEPGSSGTRRTPEVAERPGASAGKKRIVYDSAAIDQLLDRSALLNKVGEEEEENEGEDFMKGFKVASFNMVEEAEEEEEDEEEEGTPDPGGTGGQGQDQDQEKGDSNAVGHIQGSTPPVDSRIFWSGLLGDKYLEQQALEEEQMGRGRRTRGEVRYTDDVAESSSDEDYNEEEGPGTSEQKSKACPQEKTSSRKRARYAVDSRDPSAGAGGAAPRLHTGEGDMMKAWGLSRSEREKVIQTVMEFGFPDDNGLTALYEVFQNRLPGKTMKEVALYLSVVCKQINTSQPGAGASSKDMLLGRDSLELCERVAIMHMMRKKLAAVAEGQAKELFGSGSSKGLELQLVKHWKDENDVQLMRGVVTNGFGQWERILNMDPQVHQAVQREVRQPSECADKENVDATVVSTPGPTGIEASDATTSKLSGPGQDVETSRPESPDQSEDKPGGGGANGSVLAAGASSIIEGTTAEGPPIAPSVPSPVSPEGGDRVQSSIGVDVPAINVQESGTGGPSSSGRPNGEERTSDQPRPQDKGQQPEESTGPPGPIREAREFDNDKMMRTADKPGGDKLDLGPPARLFGTNKEVDADVPVEGQEGPCHSAVSQGRSNGMCTELEVNWVENRVNLLVQALFLEERDRHQLPTVTPDIIRQYVVGPPRRPEVRPLVPSPKGIVPKSLIPSVVQSLHGASHLPGGSAAAVLSSLHSTKASMPHHSTPAVPQNVMNPLLFPPGSLQSWQPVRTVPLVCQPSQHPAPPAAQISGGWWPYGLPEGQWQSLMYRKYRQMVEEVQITNRDSEQASRLPLAADPARVFRDHVRNIQATAREMAGQLRSAIAAPTPPTCVRNPGPQQAPQTPFNVQGVRTGLSTMMAASSAPSAPQATHQLNPVQGLYIGTNAPRAPPSIVVETSMRPNLGLANQALPPQGVHPQGSHQGVNWFPAPTMQIPTASMGPGPFHYALPVPQQSMSSSFAGPVGVGPVAASVPSGLATSTPVAHVRGVMLGSTSGFLTGSTMVPSGPRTDMIVRQIVLPLPRERETIVLDDD